MASPDPRVSCKDLKKLEAELADFCVRLRCCKILCCGFPAVVTGASPKMRDLDPPSPSFPRGASFMTHAPNCD